MQLTTVRMFFVLVRHQLIQTPEDFEREEWGIRRISALIISLQFWLMVGWGQGM
tara:strand:+ start:13652 stop:13813 length:162 start_codon:yes stop_codon:yes gene_type:complete